MLLLAAAPGAMLGGICGRGETLHYREAATSLVRCALRRGRLGWGGYHPH